MTQSEFGYSGRPLGEKLGIKPGHRALFVQAPKGYLDFLGPLPSGVVVAKAPETGLDFIQVFCTDPTDLTKQFSSLRPFMDQKGMLWACWPKKSSGVVTELNDNVVREIGLASGLVDVKVAAIDRTWSAEKFVIRLKDRTK